MSFSLYYTELTDWFATEVSPEMIKFRTRLFQLLQREMELREIVQIIGVEALQESDRLTLEVATVARDAFLKQSVFNEADAFNMYEKQYWMLRAIFAFLDAAHVALKRGVFVEKIVESRLRMKLLAMQNVPNEKFREEAERLIDEIEMELTGMEPG